MSETMSALTDEQIKQKWIEICNERPSGCTVSTVQMTLKLSRWVEQHAQREAAEAMRDRAALAICQRCADGQELIHDERGMGYHRQGTVTYVACPANRIRALAWPLT